MKGTITDASFGDQAANEEIGISRIHGGRQVRVCIYPTRAYPHPFCKQHLPELHSHLIASAPNAVPVHGARHGSDLPDISRSCI